MMMTRLVASLSKESRHRLSNMFSSAPFDFKYDYVEIYASVHKFEAMVPDVVEAHTVDLVTPYDEETQSSPLVMILRSPEMEAIHDDLYSKIGGYPWPYGFKPYMRMSFGSLPRKRYILSFVNSLSDAFNRNSVTLTFDRFFTITEDVGTPPFQAYFTGNHR